MPGNVRHGQDQFVFHLLENIEVAGSQHFFVSTISFVVGNVIIVIELGFGADQMQHDFRIDRPLERLETALADHDRRSLDGKSQKRFAKRAGFALQLPARDSRLGRQVGDKPLKTRKRNFSGIGKPAANTLMRIDELRPNNLLRPNPLRFSAASLSGIG